jgi:hypothetical protein
MRLKKDESGQVIVEFVIVFGLIATLIFLFVQMSWGIAWGHYVHYSTFMASRAYLSAAETKADQYNAAKVVLQQTVKAGGKDIFPFLAPARIGGERDATGDEAVPGAMVGTHPYAVGKLNSRVYSWAEGVQYNFGLKMFLVPLSSQITKAGQGQTISPGGGKSVSWKGMIPMTSDSFLGREPTTRECMDFMREIPQLSGTARGAPQEPMQTGDFIEDNGC